jgi:hypothetical protein
MENLLRSCPNAPLPRQNSTKEWSNSQAATFVCLSLDVLASSTILGKKESTKIKDKKEFVNFKYFQTKYYM